MALQILNAGPPPEEIAGRLHDAIAAAMPEATIEVTPRSAGHFEIRVSDAGFEGLSRVKQQQRVYAAIGELMTGPNAPVHAIDRLECRTP